MYGLQYIVWKAQKWLGYKNSKVWRKTTKWTTNRQNHASRISDQKRQCRCLTLLLIKQQQRAPAQHTAPVARQQRTDGHMRARNCANLFYNQVD